MNKYLKITFLMILFLLIIYIIYVFAFKNYIFYSSHIEVAIPIFAKMQEIDTHGGFHGDGESYVKVYFSDNQAEKFISKIKTNIHWQELPMPEILQKHNTINEEIKIPEIEKGYWFFIDRHNKTINKYDYSGIFDRASYNYSIAVFDTFSNILYYYALDT